MAKQINQIDQADQRARQRQRRVALLVGLGGVALCLVIWLLVRPSTTTTSTGNPVITLKRDPASGQTFYHQTGKAPEQATIAPASPQFAGFGVLLNDGITSDQVTALQQSLAAYPPFASSAVQISLATNTVQFISPDANDPLYRWSLSASIVVNQQTTYRIKVYYWGTSQIQLLISNAAGTAQLFDSGTVTGVR